MTKTKDDKINYYRCDQIAENVIQNLASLQGAELGYDFVTTVFGLYVYSSQILSQAGWTRDELDLELQKRLENYRNSLN